LFSPQRRAGFSTTIFLLQRSCREQRRHHTMFGFNKARKDPLADRKAADKWLAALPVNDPLAAVELILPELVRLGERALRTPASQEAVFRVDSYSDAIRDTLTRQYLEHGPRSNRVENQLWQALFDVTQSFLGCYQGVAEDAASHPNLERWASLLPELIVRQILHQGIEAKIRLYRYEQWIPAKCADLHGLFQRACSAQVERQSIAA